MRNLLNKLTLSIAPAALLASAACAQPAAAPAAKPDLDPAMWVVKDPDTTIYLFGTFHALDGKADWFNDEVKTAFDGSNELVMEIITPEDPAALGPVIMKHAVDTSGKTLTSKLSPEGQKRLAAALADNKLPANAFDMFRPFFAALTISVLEYQKIGMGPEQGAEKILTTAAKASKKKIGEVETIDQQMGFFNALPEAEQIRLLEKTLEEKANIQSEVGKMVTAWGSGDADAVAKLIAQTDNDSPLLYNVLLKNRNVTWAGWIQNRLAQPGTVFMAVGAGHLAGPDSVQKFLKDRGIKSERVPNKG